MQSAFGTALPQENGVAAILWAWLRDADQEFVQTRFAALGGVPVNNSPFGRLIDG